MNRPAILVVGTTSDYIALLDKGHPGRCLFVTAADERHRYPRFAPQNSTEILTDLDHFDRVLLDVNNCLKNRKIRLTGLVCYDCEAMNLAAFLGEALNLEYPDSQTIVNCRDKNRSKLLWRDHGLNCARSGTIKAIEDVLGFFDEIDGPIVIKPQNGSGSELTFQCTDKSECHDAVNIILSSPKNAGYQKAVNGTNADPKLPLAGFIVEEFIAGQEYSGDFIIDGDDLQIIRLARKFPAPDQTFGTTLAYMLPGKLPETIAEEDLKGLFNRAAQSLGIKRAICMIDFMIDHDKVYLLELSPRPGGDCLPFLIKHSLDLDIFDLTLDFAEHKKIKLPDLKKSLSHVGVRIFAERSGIVTDMECDDLKKDPRVKEVYFKYSPGHEVKLPPVDYDSRILGHIIFRSTAGGDILEECRQLLSKVRVFMETTKWTKTSA